MSEWPCCFKERGAEVGCSRDKVVIDGEEYDLIPFGAEDKTDAYDEALADFDRQIENGGRGRLDADDIRDQKQRFKKQWDKEEYNNRTCHDCAAPMGGTHHLGCDWEECPNCGGQYFICDCVTAEKQELWASHG